MKRQLAVLVIVGLLTILGLPLVMGAGEFSFRFPYETVNIGSTQAFANSHVYDSAYEDMFEGDTASDTEHDATEQWVLNATDSGTFPDDIQTNNGQYIQYTENNTGGGGGTAELEINPTADGHETDWTPKGAGSHYVEVDDPSGSPDDATTEVNINGGNQEDYWVMADHTTETGNILNVRLNLRVKHNVGGEEFNFALYDSVNGEWHGSDIADDTSWTTYYLDLDSTNPLTASQWTWADIDATELGIRSRSIGGFTGIEYCTMGYINITYESGADSYDLDVWQNITAIDSGDSYQLNVDGKIDDENMAIAVWDFTLEEWNIRGTLTSTSDQLIEYTLTSDEISGSTVRVNYTDSSAGDGSASNLWLDWVAVETTKLDYELDVERRAVDIFGSNPELQIWGTISIGAENFDVDIWNYTSSGWNTARLDSVFTPANALYKVHLVSDEISSGEVQVRFRDDTPTDALQEPLKIDMLRIYTDNSAPTIDDKIAEEYWTQDVAMSHQWNSSDSDPNAHVWTMITNASFISIAYDNRTTWVNGTCLYADSVSGSEEVVWYDVQVKVDDGNAVDTDDWILYCQFSNTAPSIADPIVEEYWQNDTAMSHQWNATDSDSHQSWTWTVEGNWTEGVISLTVQYSQNPTISGWVNGTCDSADVPKWFTVWTNVSDGTAEDSDYWELHCYLWTSGGDEYENTNGTGSGFYMYVDYGWELESFWSGNKWVFTAEVKTNVPDLMLQCHWDFGDGGKSSECNTTHVYDWELYKEYEIGLSVDNGYWSQSYADKLSQNNLLVIFLAGFLIFVVGIGVILMSKKRRLRVCTK